jgi:hypothetical protein
MKNGSSKRLMKLGQKSHRDARDPATLGSHGGVAVV